MRRWLVCLVLGLCMLSGAAAWAQPQIPPAPSGSLFVQDYAGVLSDNTKSQIGFLGSQLKGKTKAHVVVVTVKTLGDTPATDYALAIMRQWGVGDKTLNNGVVLLVAVNDRQSRIEVGYGLEGRINDAKAGRIQDEYMIPYFQQGDFNRGIFNGYQAIVNEVAQEYQVQITTDAKKTPRAQAATSQSSGWDQLPWWAKILIGAGVLGLLIIDWVFFGGQFTWLILALVFRRGGGGGGGGGGFGGGSGGGGGADRKW